MARRRIAQATAPQPEQRFPVAQRPSQNLFPLARANVERGGIGRTPVQGGGAGMNFNQLTDLYNDLPGRARGDFLKEHPRFAQKPRVPGEATYSPPRPPGWGAAGTVEDGTRFGPPTPPPAQPPPMTGPVRPGLNFDPWAEAGSLGLNNSPPPGTQVGPDGREVLPVGWARVGGENGIPAFYIQNWNGLSGQQREAIVNFTSSAQVGNFFGTDPQRAGVPPEWYQTQTPYQPQGRPPIWGGTEGPYPGPPAPQQPPSPPPTGGYPMQPPPRDPRQPSGPPPVADYTGPPPVVDYIGSQNAGAQQGGYQGPRGGAGMNYGELQSIYQGINPDRQGQFLQEHPAFNYNYNRNQPAPGATPGQPGSSEAGQGSPYPTTQFAAPSPQAPQSNAPQTFSAPAPPQAPPQNAPQGYSAPQTGVPGQTDVRAPQAPQSPGQAVFQNNEWAPGLTITPQFEAGRRALEDNLASTLSQIGVAEAEIPVVLRLAQARLKADQEEDNRRIGEGANARGTYSSGGTQRDFDLSGRGFERSRRDAASEATRSLGGLANARQGAHSDYQKGLAELILELQRMSGGSRTNDDKPGGGKNTDQEKKPGGKGSGGPRGQRDEPKRRSGTNYERWRKNHPLAPRSDFTKAQERKRRRIKDEGK